MSDSRALVAGPVAPKRKINRENRPARRRAPLRAGASLANRLADEINEVFDKVFGRDRSLSH